MNGSSPPPEVLLPSAVVGFAATAAFGAIALWRIRRDQSDRGRRIRLRVIGLLVAVSILPLEVFVEHRLPTGVWLLVLAMVVATAVVLIHRSTRP